MAQKNGKQNSQTFKDERTSWCKKESKLSLSASRQKKSSKTTAQILRIFCATKKQQRNILKLPRGVSARRHIKVRISSWWHVVTSATRWKVVAVTCRRILSRRRVIWRVVTAFTWRQTIVSFSTRIVPCTIWWIVTRGWEVSFWPCRSIIRFIATETAFHSIEHVTVSQLHKKQHFILLVKDWKPGKADIRKNVQIHIHPMWFALFPTSTILYASCVH